MENQAVYKYFCLFLTLVTAATEAYAYNKLYVFGDSYVDTGNNDYTSAAWNEPYGETYPGKPSGRYSDGRVFSDFIAEWMCIKPPVPSRFIETNSTQYGINFAVGGSGAFTTNATAQNMTVQIDQFQQLIETNAITKDDLSSSVALVSVSGNDYVEYYVNHKSADIWDWLEFIKSVVEKIGEDVGRIRDLGVAKIAVMGLHPAGCLPYFAKDLNFSGCNDLINLAAQIHNGVLNKTVQDLNEGNESKVVKFDMYGAFVSATNLNGNSQFRDPILKPCLYNNTVCTNPSSVFYWDVVHLTDAGWEDVYAIVRSTNIGLFPPCTFP